MAFQFNNNYATQMAQKRRASANFQLSQQLSSSVSVQFANNAYIDAQQRLTELNGEAAGLQGQINAATDPVTKAQLQAQLATVSAAQSTASQSVANNELLVIQSMVDQNNKLNGKNPKVNTATLLAKWEVFKTLSPGASLTSFIGQQIGNTKNPNPLNQVQDATTNLIQAANRFQNIVNGQPNGTQSALASRDPFAMFDPAVCGLIALDNDGAILADQSFNLPFQYIWGMKDSKSANYESTQPMGRFEPHRNYSGAEPYTITFECAYVAYDTGPNSDEGAIQELKDRWLASQYPSYSVNKQNGVYSYGTPRKMLLNMFKRYVNIPVTIGPVALDEDNFAYDVPTWFSMGFKLSVTLMTSVRLAQVISADDIVHNGLSTYSHKFNP